MGGWIKFGWGLVVATCLIFFIIVLIIPSVPEPSLITGQMVLDLQKEQLEEQQRLAKWQDDLEYWQDLQAAQICDPSYPDLCLDSLGPDLDCVDIPYRGFRVFPPDRHGFDRDQDGIGCEGTS